MCGFFVPPTRGRSSVFGKMQKSVMPATASPAPRSKRVSVSEGTSDTTRAGGVGNSKVRPRRSSIGEVKLCTDKSVCATLAAGLLPQTRIFPLARIDVAQTLLSVLNQTSLQCDRRFPPTMSERLAKEVTL